MDAHRQVDARIRFDWGPDEAVRGVEAEALHRFASGRELLAAGYSSDVEIAAEVGQGSAVPQLRDGWFVSASQAAHEPSGTIR